MLCIDVTVVDEADESVGSRQGMFDEAQASRVAPNIRDPIAATNTRSQQSIDFQLQCAHCLRRCTNRCRERHDDSRPRQRTAIGEAPKVAKNPDDDPVEP